MTTKRQVRGEDRREALLAAAERCFLQSGFHGARMAQIAAEAEMSAGHIYHYFNSKEDIIAALVRDHVDRKHAELKATIDKAGDNSRDVVIDLFAGKYAEATEPFWSTLMLEIVAESTRNPDIRETLRTAVCGGVDIIRDAVGGKPPPNDIDERIEILIGLFQGLAMRRLVGPDVDPEKMRALMREIITGLFN